MERPKERAKQGRRRWSVGTVGSLDTWQMSVGRKMRRWRSIGHRKEKEKIKEDMVKEAAGKPKARATEENPVGKAKAKATSGEHRRCILV